MKTKWLIFTFLLFNLSSNVTSLDPSYSWNTTDLGVGIDDAFEFKLTKYNVYNDENDTIEQGNIFLNNTSIFAREEATDDEFLDVGESFTLEIKSNGYFTSDQTQHQKVLVFVDNLSHELSIPWFNITFTHNSFVADRVIEPLFRSQGPYIIANRFATLLLIPDWEVYKLIYSDVDSYNENIIDDDNYYITNFTRSFDIGRETINYYDQQFQNIKSINRSIAPWTSFYQILTTNAIIDRGSGLVTKIEWQIAHPDTRSPLVEITIESINENNKDDTNIFSLGQEVKEFFSLTSFAILMVLVLDKRRTNKI